MCISSEPICPRVLSGKRFDGCEDSFFSVQWRFFFCSLLCQQKWIVLFFHRFYLPPRLLPRSFLCMMLSSCPPRPSFFPRLTSMGTSTMLLIKSVSNHLLPLLSVMVALWWQQNKRRMTVIAHGGKMEDVGVRILKSVLVFRRNVVGTTRLLWADWFHVRKNIIQFSVLQEWTIIVRLTGSGGTGGWVLTSGEREVAGGNYLRQFLQTGKYYLPQRQQ